MQQRLEIQLSSEVAQLPGQHEGLEEFKRDRVKRVNAGLSPYKYPYPNSILHIQPRSSMSRPQVTAACQTYLDQCIEQESLDRSIAVSPRTLAMALSLSEPQLKVVPINSFWYASSAPVAAPALASQSHVLDFESGSFFKLACSFAP